jgi:hypothetical protein
MRHKVRSDQDSSALQPVFHAEGGSLAEFEALEVKALLEANKIPVVMVGSSLFPNLPFELEVPAAEADRARRLIAKAEGRLARAAVTKLRANEEA